MISIKKGLKFPSQQSQLDFQFPWQGRRCMACMQITLFQYLWVWIPEILIISWQQWPLNNSASFISPLLSEVGAGVGEDVCLLGVNTAWVFIFSPETKSHGEAYLHGNHNWFRSIYSSLTSGWVIICLWKRRHSTQNRGWRRGGW